jgi:hypothetical protein
MMPMHVEKTGHVTPHIPQLLFELRAHLPSLPCLISLAPSPLVHSLHRPSSLEKRVHRADCPELQTSRQASPSAVPR